VFYQNRFYQTYILLRKSLWLTRNCGTWTRSNYQQVCHKEVGHNQYMLCWNYVFKWIFQIAGTFTSPESGPIKRFVITTSVNQVSTVNIKFEEAKRLRKYDWIIKTSNFYIIREKYVYIANSHQCGYLFN